MERKNLWAPWRIEYIRSLTEEGGCFICDYLKDPDKDEENLVLWRNTNCIVMLNRFPYNNGHLLIAPTRHIDDLDSATDAELLDLMKFTSYCQQALTAAISPHGFNVGMNFGRCAGAGLPGHMHIHIVPRWDGDTNYMAVCAGTDVISQHLRQLYAELKQVSAKNPPEI